MKPPLLIKGDNSERIEHVIKVWTKNISKRYKYKHNCIIVRYYLKPRQRLFIDDRFYYVFISPDRAVLNNFFKRHYKNQLSFFYYNTMHEERIWNAVKP